MQRLIYIFLTLFLVHCTCGEEQEEQHGERNGKILNLFSIVRFPNTFCIGDNSRNGTCYTQVECGNRGGTAAGSCALGYGVCCTFALGCGRTSSQNCTYFESTGNEVGACTLTICPCSDNICQLRLDFETFVINQPDTTTISSTQDSAGAGVTTATQCLIDQFSVTNPSGTAPPTICGTNTGEHMYVDASDACNQLNFQLGADNNAVTRSWRIKVSQYSCDYNNLAPDGCTQYFFGTNTDTVQTYNFAGGQHLADQSQLICVRREINNCRICWSPTAEGDFETSSAMTGATGELSFANCCGAAGMFDCAIIPNPSKKTAGMALAAANGGICGGEFGTDTAAAIAAATICSMSVPFQIRFVSDLFEGEGSGWRSFQGAKWIQFSLYYGSMLVILVIICLKLSINHKE